MTKRGAYNPWFMRDTRDPDPNGAGCPVLAAKLRKARIAMGLSQTDMAEKFLISRAQWGHYEKNRRAVPYRQKDKILEVIEDARNWGMVMARSPGWEEIIKCKPTPLEAAASA